MKINSRLKRIFSAASTLAAALSLTIFLPLSSVSASGWQWDKTSHWTEGCGAKQPHEMGNWTVTLSPTVLSDGRRERRCTVCGYWEEETLDRIAVSVPSTPYPPFTLQNGWSKIDGAPVYYKDGVRLTGWQEIDGAHYFFDISGFLCTGWILYEEGWYYLAPDGKRGTDFLTLGSVCYYLSPDTGKMQTGRMTIDETEYFFYDWGGMAKACWVRFSDGWRYYLPDGSLARDRLITDAETTVYVDENGLWT